MYHVSAHGVGSATITSTYVNVHEMTNSITDISEVGVQADVGVLLLHTMTVCNTALVYYDSM